MLGELNLIFALAVLLFSFLNYSFVRSVKTISPYRAMIFVHIAYPVLGLVLAVKFVFSQYFGICTRAVVNLVIQILMILFNYKLFKELPERRFDEDAVIVLLCIAVLWMIFERIKVPPLPHVSIVVAIALLVSSVFVYKFLRVVNLLVEMPDLKTSIKLLLVFAMFFATSDIAFSFGIKSVLRGFTIISNILALISALVYVKKLSELVRI
jgi:hypothetical protein